MKDSKEKIIVYVDGLKSKEFDTMLDALTYVHTECRGHKIMFKTQWV